MEQYQLQRGEGFLRAIVTASESWVLYTVHYSTPGKSIQWVETGRNSSAKVKVVRSRKTVTQIVFLVFRDITYQYCKRPTTVRS